MSYSDDAVAVLLLIHDGEVAWKDLRATVSTLDWDTSRALMAHDEVSRLVDEGTGRANRDGLDVLRSHLYAKKPLEDVPSQGLAPMNVRREIIAMLKQGKYAKPFEDGRFAYFSLVGTSDWEDYASVVIRMIQTDTLLNIEEQLGELLDRLPSTPGGTDERADQ